MKNQLNKEEIIKAILEGKIFIYPTDTIYGLGCNALNKEAVEKIKRIKERDRDKPLSIIVPSFDWIYEHCILSELDKQALEKYLPGPYTLILKKKISDFLSWVSNNESLGIRIPKNNFTKIIQESNIPFITTSVNLSRESPALSLENIKQDIKDQVDIIIEAEDKRELLGKPSTLIIKGKKIKRK